MKPNIGITEKNESAVSTKLATLLADEFVLYAKTRNAHWNVEGPNFHSLHVFFEKQYQQLDDILDSVAERMRKIGHYAPGTFTQYLQLTHLTEYSERKNNAEGFIRDLLADHESIIEFIRGNIDPFAEKDRDFGSSDFITGLIEEHETMAWMLRAYLK